MITTGGKLLVSHQSEANKERSVLVTYDLETLECREVGLFDGMIGQLGPSGKQLFFAFSPRGAARLQLARLVRAKPEAVEVPHATYLPPLNTARSPFGSLTFERTPIVPHSHRRP